MNHKFREFFNTETYVTPCLLIDVNTVENNYNRVNNLFGDATVYYAVKANSASNILKRLTDLNGYFDAASIGEIRSCLSVGVDPSHISYGNTIKKETDIAEAYKLGVRVFGFDSENELSKLANSASQSTIYCRVNVPDVGAEWPLSDKFGCDVKLATKLLISAKKNGFERIGASVHVGSQQVNPIQWERAIVSLSKVYRNLLMENLDLNFINLGGGFPVSYRNPVPSIEVIADVINTSMKKHLTTFDGDILLEPGRFIAADAGLIRSEIVLISKRFASKDQRWIYLDVGRYSGLAETLGEAIQYKLETPGNFGETGSVIIAGPSCDGTDIIYRKSKYFFPLSTKIGDFVDILAAGAYTSSYSTSNFNGLPSLAEYYC